MGYAPCQGEMEEVVPLGCQLAQTQPQTVVALNG